MKDFLRTLRDTLVSLKLTIVLLVFAMVLVFAATLDQVNLGVWAVQEKYFHSFVLYTRVGDMLTVPIFPAGYTIGGLLLLNLVAAHVYRFTFSWRKSGILLTHFGLILLLVGELLSGLWQEDFHMRLGEGETKSYAESYRDRELAIIDVSDATFDDVVVIPESLLARKSTIQHPKLPFRVVAKTYYPNSSVHLRPEHATAATGAATPQPTAGFGAGVLAAPEPITHRPNEQNLPSVFVELVGSEGSIGTYLVSTHFLMPQEFTYGGRSWTLALRAKRVYQPFSLTLQKFTHDRYAGTEIPKNFSSKLRLKTPDGRDDRDVLVYMNSPLRHAGLTFYQAGFEKDDRTTILQVVRNPSWLMPYISCTLMTLGLVVQFGIGLAGFTMKRAAQGSAGLRSAPRQSKTGATPPSAVVPVS